MACGSQRPVHIATGSANAEPVVQASQPIGAAVNSAPSVVATTTTAPASSIPTPSIPNSQIAAAISRLVQQNALDSAASDCLRERFTAAPELGNAAVGVLTDVAKGCARAADLVVPTMLDALRSSKHISTTQAGCVTLALYLFSSSQMDSITSAALNPKGQAATQSRQWVDAALRACGVN